VSNSEQKKQRLTTAQSHLFEMADKLDRHNIKHKNCTGNKVMAFWLVTPYSDVGYQRFGGRSSETLVS